MIPQIKIVAVIIASIIVIFIGWIGYPFLCILRRRLEEERPKQTLTLSGADFRFRNGRNWSEEKIQFTSKQVLKCRGGLIIGRIGLPGVHVCCISGTADKDYGSVSHRHARLKFDFGKGRFYLEDLNSKNTTRWSYLEEDGEVPPVYVTKRLYLDRDMRVWIGHFPLDIRISQEEPDDMGVGSNKAAMFALIAFQLVGLVMLFCRYGTQMCLPPALLMSATYAIFSGCGGRRPFCLVVMVLLTAAYFIFVIVSKSPEAMSESFLAYMYPYGMIPLCFAKKWEKTQKNPSLLFKIVAAVILAAVLHPSDVGEGVSTAVLFLLLFTDDSGVHEALTEIL